MKSGHVLLRIFLASYWIVKFKEPPREGPSNLGTGLKGESTRAVVPFEGGRRSSQELYRWVSVGK